MSSKKSKTNKIMMILSPAKTLDLGPWPPLHQSLGETTVPDCNVEKTLQVAQVMKKRSESELKKLLGVSANIAKTAAGYWNDYAENLSDRHGDEAVKPCIYSFSGAAYQGLQIQDCDEKALAYLQDCLRIIDPLYGALRPLDRMQPYRLEMASKGVLSDKKVKLADFWSPSVTESLSKDLEAFPDPILLNVASDEYAAAVDASALPDSCRYIKVVFRENGRVIAVHAKRARGLMVRFIAESQASSLEDVKQFAVEGYKFQEAQSDDSTLVFDRPKQQPAAKRTAAPAAKKTTRRKKTKR